MKSSPSIPEPRLSKVKNDTPFTIFQCDKMGVGRRFYDTVVLKGTFDLAPGKLGLAEEQLEIALADEPWDAAGAERSSLKHAGEVVWGKPSSDVIVTGTARPSSVDPQAEWDAAVEVRRRGETKLAYRAHVLGPRWWRHTAAKGWALTEPEPTLEVPIRYELAYGGAYPVVLPEGEVASELEWRVHEPNPSGTGFLDEKMLDPADEVRAPQWQLRAHPVIDFNRDAPVAGLGPIARPWSSRLQYAGTYDDAWLRATREAVEQGQPADYPRDLDPRFFQCAHPGLITPEYLEGDEEITLTGLTPGAPLSLQLPGARVVAELVFGNGTASPEACCLDTLHLDLDAAKVSLCWRLTLFQARDIRAARFFLLEVP